LDPAIRTAAFVVVVAISLGAMGCRPKATSSTCNVPERVALDAAGRADGIYSVIGDALEAAPVVRFQQLTLMTEGVDVESGKRWLRMRTAEPDASRMADFTSKPEGRSVAVVVGGVVACHHKIRTPITSPDIQLSCCNPAACDRWLAQLRPRG